MCQRFYTLFSTRLSTRFHTPPRPVLGIPPPRLRKRGKLLPHLGRQLPTKLLGYIRLVAMILVPQHGRDRIYRLARPVRAARHT